MVYIIFRHEYYILVFDKKQWTFTEIWDAELWVLCSPRTKQTTQTSGKKTEIGAIKMFFYSDGNAY